MRRGRGDTTGWRRAVMLLPTLLSAWASCLGAHEPVPAVLLPDAPEALQRKLSLIRNARSEIAVTAFLWRGDETGTVVAAALQDAARRGVQVRLVVDCLRMRIPAALVDALCATPGIKLRMFHPPSIFNPLSLNVRMHDKLLIVDRAKLVIGGRNFSDFYYDRGHGWNYVDLDLQVSGRVARDSADYFDRVWSSSCSIPWRSPPDPSVAGTARDPARQMHQRTQSTQRGQMLLDTARRSIPVRPPSAVNARAIAVPPGSVQFICEDVPRRIGTSACLTAIEEMLAGAQREVWVSTPWVVDTPRMRTAFRGCLARDVKLHFLTNGLGGCQDFAVFASHEAACREWKQAGVDVRALPGPDSLHTKALVVDGRTGAVGTFNFDPRSERWNTESMVIISNTAFAHRLLGAMQHQAACALPFDPTAWSQQGEDHATPGKRAKRWITPVLQVLSPLFRGSL